MIKIVGVTFKDNGKIYYFDLLNNNLKVDDYVIVETERGLQYGKVVTKVKEVNDNSLNANYKKVIRKANKDDELQHKRNIADALLALEKAKKMSSKLDLKMNFIEAIYTFDRNQLIFYFLADARVDFRELAKELAGIYRTRIELRQIGVRDKAKEISGIGPCGRQLCCSCFLNDLDSVTINMAKNQNLSLNPTKINGSCGRLLCCLNYEDDLYVENRQDMPEVGTYIETKDGKGYVTFIDIPNRRYIVSVENIGKVEVKLSSKCDTCEKCNK